jgi:hypothetical protein
MDCSSTYINRIYPTIIGKISDLSKKLLTLTFPDLIGTPVKGEEIWLALARKKNLSLIMENIVVPCLAVQHGLY